MSVWVKYDYINANRQKKITMNIFIENEIKLIEQWKSQKQYFNVFF